MQIQINLGNLQGVFPVQICKTLNAYWTKIHGYRGKLFESRVGYFLGWVKVVKETKSKLGVSIPVLMVTVQYLK